MVVVQEKLEGLRQQVARLQAMAARNSKDKVMLAQVGQSQPMNSGSSLL